MGVVKLYLHCPQRVDSIAADPEPDWSFDDLVSELNALVMKLSTSYTGPLSSSEIVSRDPSSGDGTERGNPFIMRAPEYEMEDTESEDEAEKTLVPGKRFTCDEHYLSDSDNSDVVSVHEVQPYLMNEVGQVEGALFELTQEHRLRVTDEIRNRISVLETALINETEKSTSALLQVEKYKEARQELDKKLDTQYQRHIAEVLDNHLTAVQRDRELRSQIEERKIRSDAAYEEAKRKEKALQEEKLRQEKIKAEAEAKFKAEEAKHAALEAERKAAMEAEKRAAMEAEKRAAMEAEKRAAVEAKERGSTEASQSVTYGDNQQKTALSSSNAESRASGNVIRAAESALNLEHGRLQKLKELYERNQAIRSSSNKDYTRTENHIARLIRQIRGISDNVRSKASELIKLLNDPQCHQSIGIEAFARKVVSYSGNPANAAFASAYVIVLVTSKVPHAMDYVLAEFHRVCIYTVPKHIVYMKTVFESKEAYFKSIGYQEDDGKMESTEDYLKRLESYMKVYGALVQTEIRVVQNVHGLEKGWAWLAMFLNAIPPNKYTAVSLNAFLQTAGFALFRRYKSHFRKLLNVISDHFLVALKERKESDVTRIIAEIESYIEDRKFLQEPEGRSMQSNLLSSEWRY